MRGQVHWVQQARARLHPGYVLSLRLGEYVNHPGQTPAGGMGHSAKASMAETGAANINTCSGPNQARYIRDAGATSTAIWSREPRGYFRSSPPQATIRPRGLISAAVAAAARRPGDRRTWIRQWGEHAR